MASGAGDVLHNLVPPQILPAARAAAATSPHCCPHVHGIQGKMLDCVRLAAQQAACTSWDKASVCRRLVTFHPFPSHMARETAPPVAASKWYKKFGGSCAAVFILLSPSLSSQFTVHLLFMLAWLVLRLIARLILQDADVQVLFSPHSCDLEVFR